MKIIIRIKSHYFRDDPRFEGDYAAISVYVNGELAREYGDAYHDRGASKAEGFIDGFAVATGTAADIEIERVQVADYVG